MSHTACFDKAHHALDLMNRLYEMRMEERHCDFVIKVGSERIPAHRNVLSAMSDYFDRMLYHDTIENSSGMVDMKNVDLDCVRICVDYIYGREDEVHEEKYENLMHVANLMQLNKLVKIVENTIGQNLSAKLFFTAKRIADMYSCEVLQDKCREFADVNFLSIEDEFGDLDKSFVTEIINSRSVKMTEVEKLEVALRWVKRDMSARSEDLAHFLECVNLRFVSVEKRQQLLHNDSLIKDNLTCVKIFGSSIIDSLTFNNNKIRKEKAIVVFDSNSGHLQQYRPRSNSWRRMHPMNADMEDCVEFSVIAHGDNIFSFLDNKKIFCLKYTDDAATWEEIMKNCGELPPIVVQGSRFYSMRNGISWLAKYFAYFDWKTMNWNEFQDKLRDAYAAALLVLRGFVYKFGGTNNLGDFVNNVQRYEPSRSEWKEMKPMREAKGDMAAVELNDKAYVMGGNNGQDSASVDCYDPEMDQWTILASMAIPRSLFGAFGIDGCIYAVGGLINEIDETASSIEKYNIKKNEWTMMLMPRGMELHILDSAQIELD